MRDKRPVDDLSIEELEQILLIKKREARMQRFRSGSQRVVNVEATTAAPPSPIPNPPATLPDPIAEPLPPHAYDGAPRFEDDLPAHAYPPVIGYPASPKVAPRRMTNQLFLLVEALAIVGLMVVLYVGYQGLKTIDANVERTDSVSATFEAQIEAQRIQPTATPLISVSQVILPGGHIWDPNGQHRFNLNEVPAPYRSAFQQQLAAPRADFVPTTEGGPIRLEIPSINIDVSVRAGDAWETLQASVGHLTFSADPGAQGNMVLVGHNDIYGEVFKRLEELQPGDEVRVQSTNGQWYTYRVRDRQIVEPSEVWVLDQGLGQEKPITTLITCYPYRVNTHRMIVFAELVS